MIKKISNNGYQLDETSTNDQFQDILDSYGRRIGCIIVNRKTSKHFKPGLLYFNNLITINNKVPDNVFYINRMN